MVSRRQSKSEDVLLPHDYSYVFFFDCDKTWVRVPNSQGNWPCKYSRNDKRLDLKRWKKVEFRNEGTGQFIAHGPGDFAKNMIDRITAALGDDISRSSRKALDFDEMARKVSEDQNAAETESDEDNSSDNEVSSNGEEEVVLEPTAKVAKVDRKIYIEACPTCGHIKNDDDLKVL